MMEAKYPLLLRRYQLNPAGAGIGKFRGGMGAIKEYVMLEDDLYSQINIEQTKHPPWGLWGGGNAGSCSVLAAAGTDREQLIQDKVSFVGPFIKGDVLVAKSGGGGGWGDPLERDPLAVMEDVLNELWTVGEVRDAYGVVLEPETCAINWDATNDLRAQRRARGLTS
jgi:N-methylhydantoinase B